VTPRIETAQVRQPTFVREAGAQTNKMPMVAIENRHLDCVHGPIIVSPLDLFSSTEVTGREVIPTKTQATQTDCEDLKKPVGSKQSKAVQTEFTSFTRPTHYHLPENHFDKYLVVDSCEDLDSEQIAQKARAFNRDFFTRYGYLFPMKCILEYFCSTRRQSNL